MFSLKMAANDLFFKFFVYEKEYRQLSSQPEHNFERERLAQMREAYKNCTV